MYGYIPKKSREIYNGIIAHRGFHYKFPENTIPAFLEAVNKKYWIELDIRLTKDGELVCIHDRYMKRLLGKKGKLSKLNLDEIKKLTVLGSKEHVPTLLEALNILGDKTNILIEVKGFLTNRYKNILIETVKNDNKIYFHAKNIFTYLKLKKIYKGRVFWILNPFRRRFNFIKSRHYIKNM